MNSLKILALNLYNIRQDLNLSIEEFAFKCSISARYYGDIERGKCNPSLEVIDKIAEATSTSSADLLTDKTKENQIG